METEERPLVSTQPQGYTPWPRYKAAILGFRNYWHPVTWSKRVGRKPLSITLLGEPVLFLRERGKVYALVDQCPHRGVPLSLGRQEFPGTWTCCYHGWTFDLKTGDLQAALTDGPDSPICGKVQVRTYPVEERGGMVWVYMGNGEAPPVEEDVPEDFLHEDAVVVGRITVQRGDWRLAAENSYDTGHAFYLHRYGNFRLAFNTVPGWSYPKEIIQNGPWLSVGPRARGVSPENYPGLGQFPRYRPWHVRPGKPLVDHSIRLPGTVRLHFKGHSYVDILGFQPVDKDHYRFFQFFITRARGLAALRFQIYYYYWMKWIHHVQFNNQDTRIVSLMPETPPDRFYRPDVSITRWRKLCEQARGEPASEAKL